MHHRILISALSLLVWTGPIAYSHPLEAVHNPPADVKNHEPIELGMASPDLQVIVTTKYHKKPRKPSKRRWTKATLMKFAQKNGYVFAKTKRAVQSRDKPKAKGRKGPKIPKNKALMVRFEGNWARVFNYDGAYIPRHALEITVLPPQYNKVKHRYE